MCLLLLPTHKVQCCPASEHNEPLRRARVALSSCRSYYARMDDDYKQVTGEEVAKAQKEPGRERRSTTLGQLPFIQHSAETVAALSRFDRACLRFLRFVVARRVMACCLITSFYVVLAGMGVVLGCLDISPNYQYEWVACGVVGNNAFVTTRWRQWCHSFARAGHRYEKEHAQPRRAPGGRRGRRPAGRHGHGAARARGPAYVDRVRN